MKSFDLIFIMYCSSYMKDNLQTSSHNVWYVMEHFVNFVALQMRVYYHTAYTPFHSFPLSLSVSCNLNPVCTRAPPPRQLTFPLIHSEVPQGVNNCTVYSHDTASTGLIQLIKVVAVNQLTDWSGAIIHSAAYFIHWHADCGWLCCWDFFQIRQGRGSTLRSICHV